MKLFTSFVTLFCSIGIGIAAAVFLSLGLPKSFGQFILGLAIASLSFTTFLITALYMIGTYL